MKPQQTLEQKRVVDDCVAFPNSKATLAYELAFANACALDRIAQAINRFADVVEKATKERA